MMKQVGAKKQNASSCIIVNILNRSICTQSFSGSVMLMKKETLLHIDYLNYVHEVLKSRRPERVLTDVN
ncbi:hypothetical protein FRX31_033107 [Thalictrum thalictroides]|uniref:Uncharacterized protein n=1 Tax=Thalictrum thalictroides TaxID=46969 RepID=A0A7J6UXI4_THATH|nr:hypothetical protein FRX31_033107 [Thalictrum thalictroides]